MRTRKIAGLAALAFTGGLISSCDLLKDVTYEVTPCPLEAHGDSVEVIINATIAEKGMNKKAYVEFTPMIGDTKLKMVAYQGEKATGNGKVIPKSGGKISYTDKVAYKDAYENTELKIQVVGSKGEGGKEKLNEVTDPLCLGTIITSKRVSVDAKVVAGADEFQRPTEHDTACMINYLKNRHEVRATELRQDDIKAIESFIDWAMGNPKIEMMHIDAEGHASPEGEEDKNNTLSENRSKSGMAAMIKIMKKKKFEAGTEEGFYKPKAYGEDVEGFKKLVAESDIEDKNTILSIIKNYSDNADQEIKNLSKTYAELEKNILPQLRRTRLNIHYKDLGLTDEELKAVSKSDPDSLHEEQLLFTATLVDDLNEKLRLYNEVVRQYPEDWRGHNNAGYILFMQGKVSDAEAAFQKAAEKEENAIVKNNLGAVALVKGDRRKAMDLFEQATSAGSEVSYNMGVVNIMDGKYSEAVTNFGSDASYNKALAQILNGDTGSAGNTVDASDDKETARGYYLKAVIGARTKNQDMMINNLKSAIAKDSALKAQAAKDMEFYDWFENDVFKSAIQ